MLTQIRFVNHQRLNNKSTLVCEPSSDCSIELQAGGGVIILYTNRDDVFIPWHQILQITYTGKLFKQTKEKPIDPKPIKPKPTKPKKPKTSLKLIK